MDEGHGKIRGKAYMLQENRRAKDEKGTVCCFRVCAVC